ncbi:MlaA family lipoprotein [Arboricoccus pini]|uniref:MlaA family lipoprotein n=1 Tax=Arboricoccus pini TaxID=1963835 RepID=UPI001A9C50EB|nr:VacJ family lipoprotein [Arboricoccus pini]
MSAASLGKRALPKGWTPPDATIARRGLRSLVLLLALAMSACAAVPAEDLGTPPPKEVLDTRTNRIYPIEVPDPLEGYNRSMYAFNALADKYVLLPVVHGYEYILPTFVQDRVSNFFLNLGEIRNATNGLLQARPEIASLAVIRFAVNSTFGLLGTFDVAGALGAQRQVEDFGQTLGRWGVAPGPFLVLPIFGPSTVRDTTGLATDSLTTFYLPPGKEITDWVYFNPGVYVLRAVDERHQNSFRYYSTGSPFEYDLVRFLYMKKRDLEIQK